MRKLYKTPIHTDIVVDINILRQPTKKVNTISEGENIAAKLFKILNKTKTGIGLTANQIGIDSSVFVINVKEPLYFINPKIIKYGKNKIIYKESCLSLPGKVVITSRSNYIEIIADNLEKPMLFKSKNNYKSTKDLFNDLDLLECVAIQHEYHHTLGKLIIDDDISLNPKPIHNNVKHKRNDIITIKNGDEIKTIKYKHYNEQLKKDGWIIN